MNEMETPQGPELNGKEGMTAVALPRPVVAETLIPIEEETVAASVVDTVVDTVVVGESSPVFVAELAADEAPATAVADTDASFNALHSLTRLLVGGALEGSAELAQRLEVWETFLREEMDEDQPATIDGQKDLVRYAVVGLVFEGEDKIRSGLSRLWDVQKRLAQTAVRTTRPVTNSRLMSPIQRRLDEAAERGQAEIVRWIQRGQMEEPISRELARLAFGETVDEFIEHLAENREVQELVQQQSVGLASEVVDQVRQRTFTADTLVERIARAVTRRAPRLEPPAADLSDFDQSTLPAPGKK